MQRNSYISSVMSPSVASTCFLAAFPAATLSFEQTPTSRAVILIKNTQESTHIITTARQRTNVYDIAAGRSPEASEFLRLFFFLLEKFRSFFPRDRFFARACLYILCHSLFLVEKFTLRAFTRHRLKLYVVVYDIPLPSEIVATG